jgi:SAM-dependent methyltransferase
VSAPTPITALLDQASERYRRAGRFAWNFARGKLKGDPFSQAFLRLGLLHGYPRLLDLGCGQGLLAAWLLAARDFHRAQPGAWPPGWPAPPEVTSYTGVELNPNEVRRARAALAAEAGVHLAFLEGDIAAVAFPAVDAVVIMDVLHYLDYPAQELVLQRVHAALPRGGRLLLRIGDAAGGFGFTLSKLTDHVVCLFRGGRWHPLRCRSLTEWQGLLARSGFSATAMPMNEGTPFPNVLLVAEAQ